MSEKIIGEEELDQLAEIIVRKTMEAFKCHNIKALENSIKTLTEVISELRALSLNIAHHNNTLSWARTFGAVGSLTGSGMTTISLLTVSTLPASAAVAGCTVALFGGVSTITSIIGDHFASVSFKKAIDNITKKVHDSQKDVANFKDVVGSMTQLLCSNSFLNAEESREKILNKLNELGDKVFTSSSSKVVMMNINVMLINLYSALRQSATFNNSSISTTAKSCLKKKVVPSKITQTVETVGVSTGRTIGKETLLHASAGIFILGVGVYDMYSAIKSWNEKHPTYKQVVDIIEELEHDLHKLTNAYQGVGNVTSVFHSA